MVPFAREPVIFNRPTGIPHTKSSHAEGPGDLICKRGSVGQSEGL